MTRDQRESKKVKLTQEYFSLWSRVNGILLTKEGNTEI